MTQSEPPRRRMLEKRERERLAAEQRAYAERALREELQERLDRPGGDPRDGLGGGADQLARSGEPDELQERLRGLEAELHSTRARAEAAERAMAQADRLHETIHLRLDELAARLAAVSSVRELLAATEKRLADRLATDQRLAATLVCELRTRIDGLLAADGEAAGREPAGVEAAGGEAAGGEAIIQASPARDAQAPAPGPRARAAPARAVEPARLSAALVRLRESALAGEGEADDRGERTSRGLELPRSRRALRRRVREDAAAVGQLLLVRLPALAQAAEQPTFDLVLAEGECLQVTPTADPEGPVRILSAPEARAMDAVAARLEGDPAALARLLASGRVRRRLRVDVARIRGDRRVLGILEALLLAPGRPAGDGHSAPSA
ncbi:MAG: hypothetical protein ACYC91_02500 [Solirubrobacteraceae bacterium]